MAKKLAVRAAWQVGHAAKGNRYPAGTENLSNPQGQALRSEIFWAGIRQGHDQGRDAFTSSRIGQTEDRSLGDARQLFQCGLDFPGIDFFCVDGVDECARATGQRDAVVSVAICQVACAQPLPVKALGRRDRIFEIALHWQWHLDLQFAGDAWLGLLAVSSHQSHPAADRPAKTAIAGLPALDALTQAKTDSLGEAVVIDDWDAISGMEAVDLFNVQIRSSTVNGLQARQCAGIQSRALQVDLSQQHRSRHQALDPMRC
ncbi:MAG: hypothetical protein A2486_15115 [Burkholderiales bacterium RIFOXYC12_FULL_65_23]|nr:MAG: hypothetical protein A2486_15115 [Burkholderiales bacterium RIFOXYC12_FULL_65_23]